MTRATVVASFAFLAAASTAQAGVSGHIAIVGTGSASAKPELVELTVQVVSECYDTAEAAKTDNAKLANIILSELQSYGPDVVASGGPAVLRNNTWDAADEPCKLTWATSNTLVLTSHDLENLIALEDRVIHEIDQFRLTLSPGKARTYAELATPDFSLTKETTVRLQGDADIAAYDNAKAQIDRFSQHCGLFGVHLASVTQPGDYVVVPVAQQQQGNGGAPAPLIPDSIKVTSQLKFDFSYEDSGSCPL